MEITTLLSLLIRVYGDIKFTHIPGEYKEDNTQELGEYCIKLKLGNKPLEFKGQYLEEALNNMFDTLLPHKRSA